ncbi:MAG: polysaccharide deacetylase family protein [Oscillospiraceae bacterium]|nr:polysaccharide deacetylase family protein [Oscillospiraceae bacterium]
MYKEKKLKFAVTVIMLAILFVLMMKAITTAAAPSISTLSNISSGVPSIFCNDSAFQLDSVYPLEFRDGIAYIPIEIFTRSCINYIITQSQDKYTNIFSFQYVGENGRGKNFISFVAKDSQAENLQDGTIICVVYKIHGTMYIPAQLTADSLGLIWEYNGQYRTGRIKESSAEKSFEQLISRYIVQTTLPLPATTTAAPVTTAPTTTVKQTVPPKTTRPNSNITTAPSAVSVTSETTTELPTQTTTPENTREIENYIMIYDGVSDTSASETTDNAEIPDKNATTSSDMPSLFCNDTAFQLNNVYPLEIIDGIAYIPIDIFTRNCINYIITQSQDDYTNNFVIQYVGDSGSGKDYISFSVSDNLATNIQDGAATCKVYNLHSTVYIPAQLTASSLGLNWQYNSQYHAGRISELSAEKSFDMLIAKYIVQTTQTNITGEISETVSEPTVESESIGSLNKAERIDAVLNNLQKNGIRALFFMSGSEIIENPDILRKIIASGNDIGIKFESGKMNFTADDLITELESANSLIYSAVKQKTRFCMFGDNDNNSAEIIKSYRADLMNQGYYLCEKNTDISDITNMPNESLKNMIDLLKRQKINLISVDISAGDNYLNKLIIAEQAAKTKFYIKFPYINNANVEDIMKYEK